VSLTLDDEGFDLTIVGSTDDVISQTAAFFISLMRPPTNISGLSISNEFYDHHPFNFGAAGCRCLVDLFETLPSLQVTFQNLTLSAAQSNVLATRLRPIDMAIWDSNFADGGNAFVSALQGRGSPFGSLTFQCDGRDFIDIDDDIFKRLLEVDTIQHLHLPYQYVDRNHELILAPFSAKVESLNYYIWSDDITVADLESLVIHTSKLSLRICCSDERIFPTDFILTFWRRIASLGHFVELEIEMLNKIDIPDCVVLEIINAALANKMLRFLSLWDSDVDWAPHLRSLLHGLKDHKELRTLRISVDDERAFGHQFTYLIDFLSHHRNITVVDLRGDPYSDGLLVEKIYSLNRFYRGSASLAVKPPLERPMLVAAALTESALNDFQRSALLLSNHLDALNYSTLLD
jgi:hypothetical protein